METGRRREPLTGPRSVFRTAVQIRRLEEPEGSQALEELARSDPELHREVLALLAAMNEASESSFLETPLAVDPGPDFAPLPSGCVLGPYEIISVLSEGTAATVYLASQRERIEREVVLKHLYRLSGEALDRLAEAEIQTRLQHPGIAKVLDVHVDEELGQFLVLEHVQGVPLTDFARRADLDLRDRAELFLSVCDAVAFMHRQGVIHRDLKPGNILANDRGPIVLDFGLALVAGSAGDSLGWALGTPGYASPEQEAGQPLTTATDVFSLGVVLRELLSVRGPNREPDSEDVSRRLPDELHSICAKAAREAPDDRYSSVVDLASDLRNWLDHRPVNAHSSSQVYRLGKVLRRNPGVALLGCLLMVSLAAGAIQARQRSLVVAEQRDRAEETTQFLIDLFEAADPEVAFGEQLLALDLLDAGAERVEQYAFESDGLRAQLASTLAGVYSRLGQFQRAIDLLEISIALWPEIDGGERKLFGDRMLMVSQFRDLDQLQEARQLLGPLLDEHAGSGTLEEAEALNELGLIQFAESDFDASEASMVRALELAREFSDQDEEILPAVLANYGRLLWRRSRYEEAEPAFREAASLWKGENELHPLHANALNGLGELLRVTGSHEEAKEVLLEAISIRRQVLPRGSPDIANSLVNLSAVYYATGEHAASIPILEEAIEIIESSLGRRHSRAATALNNLGANLLRLKRVEEAERTLREVVEIRREIYGDSSPEVAQALSNLAVVVHTLDRTPEAIPMYEEALAIREATEGEQHIGTATTLLSLGSAHASQKRYAIAQQYLERALASFEVVVGVDHHRYGKTLGQLGEIRFLQGDAVGAEGEVRRALQIVEANLPEDHAEVLDLRHLLAAISLAGGSEAGRQAMLEVRDLLLGTVMQGSKRHEHIISREQFASDMALVSSQARVEE